MSTLFHNFIYQPLYETLLFLYSTVAFQDLGIAIILLTILVRIVLFPLFYKSSKNQMILQKLQPALQKIQQDHKHDKEKQAQAMMELYKTHQVNPFSSFLMLFIQLPILIALYQVFLGSLPNIHSSFLGLINLQDRNIIIVGLAAITQYFQGSLALPKPTPGQALSTAEKVGRQMVFLGPALTVLILSSLPAAVGLYWITTSVFSIFQQIYINKTVKVNL